MYGAAIGDALGYPLRKNHIQKLSKRKDMIKITAQ